MYHGDRGEHARGGDKTRASFLTTTYKSIRSWLRNSLVLSRKFHYRVQKLFLSWVKQFQSTHSHPI